MFFGFVEWKRPTDERNFPVIREIGWVVGAAVGIGCFAIAAEVHAAQQHDATAFVFEIFALDTDALHESPSTVTRGRAVKSDRRLEKR